MNVLDASAILAFLQGETGADTVEGILDGGVVGGANWSEVAQKVQRRSGNWSAARALLDSFGVVVEPVTRVDAEAAAELWRDAGGLSLADRLCLALGQRLDATVYTADTAWGTEGRIRQIR